MTYQSIHLKVLKKGPNYSGHTTFYSWVSKNTLKTSNIQGVWINELVMVCVSRKYRPISHWKKICMRGSTIDLNHYVNKNEYDFVCIHWLHSIYFRIRRMILRIALQYCALAPMLCACCCDFDAPILNLCGICCGGWKLNVGCTLLAFSFTEIWSSLCNERQWLEDFSA